jgi:hypothetical protein
MLPAPMARPERRQAIALADRLLEGVGDGAARVDPSERVIHVRRPLTSDEEAMLPGWWHARAPIDGAGRGGFLDALARQLR